MRFTVHYENGFTIARENGGASSILYRYPFERLKMSADDGIRNLYLDFGGPEGELVSLSGTTAMKKFNYTRRHSLLITSSIVYRRA